MGGLVLVREAAWDHGLRADEVAGQELTGWKVGRETGGGDELVVEGGVNGRRSAHVSRVVVAVPLGEC